MSGESMAILSPAALSAVPKTKTFKSTIGIVLTCLGAAVGTGNIWRFPRIVANNTGEGGALAFLLIWILFLFIWSIPLLLVEYGLGRFTRCASILSFHKMTGEKTLWCGAFIGFVSAMIACYYAVICGWCLYYTVYFMANPLPLNVTTSEVIFTSFANSPWPVLCQALVIILGGLSVWRGVRSIEPIMLGMVPILLVLMIISFIYSLTLPFASIGIRHLFSMDASIFTSPKTWIDALTQNAWDTGAAGGVLLVYASYLGREHGVVKYGSMIPCVNNFLSLLMAITIFSTVFSVQVSMDNTQTISSVLDTFTYNGPANTGLTFVWIPILFSTLTGGRVFVVFFFICLFLAGFSSQVSQIETAAHQLADLKVSRKFGVPLLCAFLFIVGLGSSININFLVNQDFVWSSAIMISGAMFSFLVIRYGVTKFRTEVVNNFGDGSDWKLPVVWEWVILILIPLEILLLFLWWIIDRIQDHEHIWYELTQQSLMMAVLQWVIAIAVLIAINVFYSKFARRALSSSYHIFEDDSEHPQPSTVSTLSNGNYGIGMQDIIQTETESGA